MKKLVPALVLLALCGAAEAAPLAAPAQAQRYDLGVRVWADEDRDVFRPGERVRLQFHATRSAYVAVIHLTTDGEVEFLYPRSPWDDGYVRGGRTYSLPYDAGGDLRAWTVRGSSGIGYVYAVASEEPLDFAAFQDGRHRSDWAYRRIGSSVRGDPYYALDRITELLVPYAEYGDYATDYYAYHVGRRHTYPRYACYDAYADMYSWGGYYDRCDRLRVLLRDDPYYYDPRRYRRSRGYYLVDRGRSAPDHRFKEPRAAVGSDRDRYGDRRDYGAPPLRRSGTPGASYDEPSRVRPEPRARSEEAGWGREVFQQGQQPKQGEQGGKRTREERPRTEERSRPTLQRRPTEPETSRPRVTAPQREPQREAPRERPRSEPAREERPRSSEGGSARVRPEGEP
ncbi:MAG TPA: DUF4384 domain-containing protein [Longimicrobiaceae bacterium]|nr:DUF4384 domain-containing protein [Longimicrobiaceae bacterium]